MTATPAQSVTGSTPGSSRSLGAVARWLTLVDHVRIGLSLVGGAALWLAIATVLGAVLGVERFDSAAALVDAGAHTQLFSMHQFALVFGVAAPLMLGVAIWSVPSQLHASNLSLPRLAAFGWWSWLAGSIVVFVSYLSNGGPGGGAEQYVEMYLLGLGLVIVGLVAPAVSLATTVLTRRNGQPLASISLGAFSALVGAVGIVLTLPVALGTTVYLWVDYVNARVAFGGADLLSSWLGWAMREPQSLLYVVPALGVLGDAAVRTAKSRQPLRGVMLTGVGIAAAVVLSSVTQQAHVFAVGTSPSETVQSFVPFALFNLVPLLAPVLVILLSLLALKAGKPALSGAFVASFLGVGMIFTGLVGSAVMHLDALNLVGTVFGEATLVHVVYGAVLSAMGAIALHAGTVTGKALPDVPVVLLSLLGVLATVLASLPHYVAGFLDQPAASATGFDDSGVVGVANIVTAAGHVLMLLVLVAFLGLFGSSRRADTVTDRYRVEASA
jgi:heme/copper-type cytochrome/quinol oxidase subunit 1